MPDEKIIKTPRLVTASLLIITRRVNDTVHILRKWDQEANQYQLIGGEKEDDESPLETAIREMEEEIPDNNLMHGCTYFLEPVNMEPILASAISPTYGIATKYSFYLFSAKFGFDDLYLNEEFKWSDLNKIRNHTSNEKEDYDFYDLILGHLSLEYIEKLPSIDNHKK